MPLVSRVDTVFMPAIDPIAAGAWYRQLFSMETVFEEDDYVALRFGGEPRSGTAITLYRATVNRDAHPAFNFFADDVDLLRQTLITQGCEATAIQRSGDMLHLDFRDISGNWVNVCHFGRPA